MVFAWSQYPHNLIVYLILLFLLIVGMVKRVQLKIIHEQGNRILDELNVAISDKRELRASVSVPPEIDPKVVYSLFKNMSDEVLFNVLLIHTLFHSSSKVIHLVV